MSRTDVLQLVSDFSLGVEDSTEVGVFYDEIVRELAFRDILTSTQPLPVTAGTSEYAVAVDTIATLEVHSNQGVLHRIHNSGLGAIFGSTWRTQVGSPVAYTQDNINEDTIQLIPIPDASDVLTIIRSETRVDVPTWLELPIAFEILAREFLRESDHQDIEFSTTCQLFATLIFSLVGIASGQQAD
jgi:hypothetical protein